MFKNFEYLIYSPHKTATQSVKRTLTKNGFKANHIHTSFHFNASNFGLPSAKWDDHEKEDALIYFLFNIEPKIIYILRDPIERLRSSYFQSNHDDLINFNGVEKNKTPIMKNSVQDLFIDFISKIRNKSGTDSIYELESITGLDIFNNLQAKKGFFYYEYDYIKIFVLEFNKLLLEKEIYLSSCLNIKVLNFKNNNLTAEKPYIDKYIDFKKMKIDEEVKNLVKKRYEKVEKLLIRFKTEVT